MNFNGEPVNRGSAHSRPPLRMRIYWKRTLRSTDRSICSKDARFRPSFENEEQRWVLLFRLPYNVLHECNSTSSVGRFQNTRQAVQQRPWEKDDTFRSRS